jgi:dolichol kinase
MKQAATEKTPLTVKREVGVAAHDYSDDWTTTFDLVLVILMISLFLLLALVTTFTKPELWSNTEFWIYQTPKPIGMMSVSVLCGLLCRYLCGDGGDGTGESADEHGYIKSAKNYWFKVNYTRKVQHFCAYLIPLVIPTPVSCNCKGLLDTVWGMWFTLMSFCLLIKPIREACTFFMLQFNSMDRPEDRPFTLKWIVGGNILPGTACIIFFRWLYGPYNAEDLTLIFVFITGLGDGFAEPVGIWLGRHKYETGALCSGKENIKYERSYEGSACVFLSGMLFTSMKYSVFQNSTQFWTCFWVMGPAVAYIEAVSPHTMDTPFLMCTGGFIIYACLVFL